MANFQGLQVWYKQVQLDILGLICWYGLLRLGRDKCTSWVLHECFICILAELCLAPADLFLSHGQWKIYMSANCIHNVSAHFFSLNIYHSHLYHIQCTLRMCVNSAKFWARCDTSSETPSSSKTQTGHFSIRRQQHGTAVESRQCCCQSVNRTPLY